MATRNIIKSDNSTLRKKSKAITQFDSKLAQLLDDMLETMRANEGMGLAAVQVGVLKRACIVETDEQVVELVNPILVKTKGSTIDNEGCLSVEGFRGIVERPEKIVVDYYDRDGNANTLTAQGYTARAFLHEMDHLDGILFTDKMIRKATKEDYE